MILYIVSRDGNDTFEKSCNIFYTDTRIGASPRINRISLNLNFAGII